MSGTVEDPPPLALFAERHGHERPDSAMRALCAQLRLVAHGQTIGYGELVTVGEHLGIRIIRMAHRHGPIQ